MSAHGDTRAFSSALGVGEALSIREAGVEPVGIHGHGWHLRKRARVRQPRRPRRTLLHDPPPFAGAEVCAGIGGTFVVGDPNTGSAKASN